MQISRHGLLQGSLPCLELCWCVLLLGMPDEVGEVVGVADGVGSCIVRLAMLWFSIELKHYQFANPNIEARIDARESVACLQLCQGALLLGMIVIDSKS